jgi:hypothetical protein
LEEERKQSERRTIWTEHGWMNRRKLGGTMCEEGILGATRSGAKRINKWYISIRAIKCRNTHTRVRAEGEANAPKKIYIQLLFRSLHSPRSIRKWNERRTLTKLIWNLEMLSPPLRPILLSSVDSDSPGTTLLLPYIFVSTYNFQPLSFQIPYIWSEQTL